MFPFGYVTFNNSEFTLVWFSEGEWRMLTQKNGIPEIVSDIF